MPNTPEAVYAMLACVRIGAMHSVIFAGYSVEAIRSRILDAKAKIIITATSVRRGGRNIPLKPAVDEALQKCPDVTKVFVWKREGDECAMVEGRYNHVYETTKRYNLTACRDECLLSAMEKQSTKCEPEKMDSEDGMFLLFTSGSTGQPKGIMHTTGGYLVHAAVSFKYVFDYRENGIIMNESGICRKEI